MKKLLVLAVMVGLVSGCERTTSEVSGKYQIPSGLTDCTIYRLNPAGLDNGITVMRCPNSTTSVTRAEGKTTITNIVVDGIEYSPTK